jgi:lysophospholipase L1-like esterase
VALLTNPLKWAKILPISYANSQAADLNNAIPSWAASHNTTQSPIWVVDQYTNFPMSDLRDGVHPNSAGDQLMESRWYPALVNAVNIIRANRTGSTV